MLDVYFSCGVWRLTETNQWKFVFDEERGGSLTSISEGISFNDLVSVVLEDFEVCVGSVKISYTIPGRDDLPPMFIRNERQFCAFMKKFVQNQWGFQLCVTVDEGETSSNPIIEANTMTDKEKVDVIGTASTCDLVSGENEVIGTASTCDIGFPSPTNANPDFRHDPIERVAFSSSEAPPPAPTLNVSNERGLSSSCVGQLIDKVPSNSSSSFASNDFGIYVGKFFRSKDEMLRCLERFAMEKSFEYRSGHSDRSRCVLRCIDRNCSWKFRAISKNKAVGSFVITKYVSEHSCDSSLRNVNHTQANAKVLGDMVSSHYEGGKDPLRPKQLMEVFRKDHGVVISYGKAWRAQEHAIRVARGTDEDGYQSLPSWFHMIQVKNPGSITFLEVDADNKFKYAFLAFGASIRGLKLMRKVIAIDGSHLKAKFKGTLLAASTLDCNFQLYPIAFGIVDSENEASWDWFLNCLKSFISDEVDLVVVSDRANSIATALSKNYPNAHHGICVYHLMKNLETHFRSSAFLPLVTQAAYAYSKQEFDELFAELTVADPNLAKYLWEIDVSKWSRAYAPFNRYNIMTSNLAESLNSMLRVSREYPIVCLFDTLRSILTRWFHERREEGIAHRHTVTKNVGIKMTSLYNSFSRWFEVAPVNRFQFEVKGDRLKHFVDLHKRECTCRVFDIERYPCSHAIAAAKKINLCENDYVDDYFSNER